MTKEEITQLRNLSRRATDNHVIGNGSANIVIHAAEFYALEEAIELLSKQPETLTLTPSTEKRRQTTEKQVISGYHRPVCVKCGCELRPETNGVGVLDMAERSREQGKDAIFVHYEPYELWDADKWKCPQCGMEVVGGFGHDPISMHHEANFQQTIKHYKTNSSLIMNKG